MQGKEKPHSHFPQSSQVCFQVHTLIFAQFSRTNPALNNSQCLNLSQLIEREYQIVHEKNHLEHNLAIVLRTKVVHCTMNVYSVPCTKCSVYLGVLREQ